ncbi:MAG: hypothetical protein KatS3mg116_1055 [Elioraea sp.]|jgi:FkbM family methyltransferase|nr:MAG: hypothetical protein KatS3mg116_1055 [Elioraea sp.]
MFLVSRCVEVAAKCLGPKAEFRLRLFRARRYRTGELEWHLLDLLCDRARIAIDIGANRGMFAGRLASLCREVHAFEPLPACAAALRENLPSNVTVHESALSDRTGYALLKVPIVKSVMYDGLSSIEHHNMPGKFFDKTDGLRINTIRIKMETLDDLCLHDVGFIKIDVEGHEESVLVGGRRTISQSRPICLVEAQQTTNPHSPYNVFKFFASIGYEGWFLVNSNLLRVSEFELSEHQDWNNRHNLYVNNFLFFPEPLHQLGRDRLERRASAVLRRRRGI